VQVQHHNKNRKEKINDSIQHGRREKILWLCIPLFTLACDKLDIPLQKALKAQRNLIKGFGKSTKRNAYDTLLNALHSTLDYSLGASHSNIE